MQYEETKMSGCYPNPEEALSDPAFCDADLLFLDIDPLEDMNENIRQIRENAARLRIVALSADPMHAVEMFRLHVMGFVTKPLEVGRLREEISYAAEICRGKPVNEKTEHIFIRTFGEFDVFVDGLRVMFKRSKAKELLAYLTDRRGGSVTRAAAFSILWEEKEYDRPMQKQMDVVIRSLRDTLRQYGIEEIFSLDRGYLSLCVDHVSCDLYQFLDGNRDAVDRYFGEYMNSYSWADLTEGFMTKTKHG